MLSALAAGKTLQIVATQLHLAPLTVHFHAGQLKRRFQVPDTAALSLLAVHSELLAPAQWLPELSGITEIDLPC